MATVQGHDPNPLCAFGLLCHFLQNSTRRPPKSEKNEILGGPAEGWSSGGVVVRRRGVPGSAEEGLVEGGLAEGGFFGGSCRCGFGLHVIVFMVLSVSLQPLTDSLDSGEQRDFSSSCFSLPLTLPLKPIQTKLLWAEGGLNQTPFCLKGGVKTKPFWFQRRWK